MSAITVTGPGGAPIKADPAFGQKLASSFTPYSNSYGSFYDAASGTDPDVANWRPNNPSPQSALTYERDSIASRVHDMARNDGWASAGVQRLVDSIVGSGWRLSAKPNWKLLGITQDDAQELALQIEAAWKDYSENFECCDAGQRLTMGGLLALAFRHRIQDGESFSLSLWLDRGGDWATAQMILHPDRVSNPFLRIDSVFQRAGVEMDAFGAPVAYHVRSAHPGDIGVIGAFPWVWDRIPRKYDNGRWLMVHAFEPKAAGQVRGEPPLAPILKKLRMLNRYDEAELEAAVLNAVMAAFVTSPNDHDQIAEAMSSDDPGISRLQKHRKDFYGETRMNMPGVKINFLFPEDKFDFSRPAHPNANFENFFRAGLRNVAATQGLSYEQLSADWSQVNYSSARAALLEVWRGFTARKDNFAAQHMQPHYANWLEEAIARGKVKLPKGAPKFREAKQAYCAARWIGPPRGWVDPEKEGKASMIRIDSGLSTFERECAEQGLDYIEVFDQRARERKEMLDRGLNPDTNLVAKPPLGTQPDPQDPASADRLPPAQDGEDGETQDD